MPESQCCDFHSAPAFSTIHDSMYSDQVFTAALQRHSTCSAFFCLSGELLYIPASPFALSLNRLSHALPFVCRMDG